MGHTKFVPRMEKNLIFGSVRTGRLIVAMAEEIRALHYDRRRWKDVLRNSPTMHMELRKRANS